MNKKYLSDGRKVIVKSQLNSQETIVQEIFINKKGDEIPSGEEFVVKSLHNEPVISYKDKTLKEIEKQISILEANKKNIKRESDLIFSKLKGYREIIKSTEKFVNLLPENDLEIFSQFLTGTVEYLVFDGYEITEPVKMIDNIIKYENQYLERYFDSIKLISVLGRSEGELEFRIHQYSDHSGGYSRVYPFKCIEDALEHIKTQAEKEIERSNTRSGLSDNSYNNCIKMGIKFSKEHTEIYQKKSDEKKNEHIDIIKKEIAKQELKLKKLTSGTE